MAKKSNYQKMLEAMTPKELAKFREGKRAAMARYMEKQGKGGAKIKTTAKPSIKDHVPSGIVGTQVRAIVQSMLGGPDFKEFLRELIEQEVIAAFSQWATEERVTPIRPGRKA